MAPQTRKFALQSSAWNGRLAGNASLSSNVSSASRFRPTSVDRLVSLVDPLLARAEGVAEHGDAPHQDEDKAHPVEHAELRNSHLWINLYESFSMYKIASFERAYVNRRRLDGVRWRATLRRMRRWRPRIIGSESTRRRGSWTMREECTLFLGLFSQPEYAGDFVVLI